MSINLTSVHVLHCIFSLVGIGEFNIAEAASILWVETVGGKFNILYFSIAAEDLDDVLLGDISCEASNVDA